MASLQLLKSNLSPISASQSTNYKRKLTCFCPEFSSEVSRRKVLKFRSVRNSKRLINGRFRVYSKLQDGDSQRNGEEPTESLFMKELKKRGMNPTSLLEESNRSNVDDEIRLKEEIGGFSNANGVSTDLEKSLSNQRERSMALNSEGLEGLFPRAKQLLTLGGTFFLSFWQLVLLTAASFIALYLYFGPTFVHDGQDRVSPPQYIDPYALLEEDRISQTAPRLN